MLQLMMIRSFRHKGLKRLYQRDDGRDLPPDRLTVIRRILTDLDVAKDPQDLCNPAYRLHPLTGQRRGGRSIRVTRNWRITFRFEGGDIRDVNYEDYH